WLDTAGGGAGPPLPGQERDHGPLGGYGPLSLVLGGDGRWSETPSRTLDQAIHVSARLLQRDLAFKNSGTQPEPGLPLPGTPASRVLLILTVGVVGHLRPQERKQVLDGDRVELPSVSNARHQARVVDALQLFTVLRIDDVADRPFLDVAVD